MSTTIIAIALGVTLTGASVGVAMISYDYEKNRSDKKKVIISAILAGIAAASLIFSIHSFNSNRAESQRACIDKGGFIYKGAGNAPMCVDKIPQVIHKL